MLKLDGPVTVPPAGRTPNRVLLVGQSPGIEEAQAGRPFVGASGRLQEELLQRHRLTAHHWRRTNIVQEYPVPKSGPSVDQIRRWTPVLEDEIRTCNPDLIIAVGAFAAQWFLGPCTMELVHGIPHPVGAFDPDLRSRVPNPNVVVLPIYHPAAAFHDESGELLSYIWWDYQQVSTVLSNIERGRPVQVRSDRYAGRESYVDVSGAELADHLTRHRPPNIAIDTEGDSINPYTSIPWSIQVTTSPGTAFVLRCSRPDFAAGISALRTSVQSPGTQILLHHGMYDIGVCRRMGLSLRRARIWDSMYALYLLRLEPQALKLAAWRWCGMRMTEYQETVGDVAKARQIDYLSRCLDVSDWPEPEREVEIENDGTTKLTRPKPIPARILSILSDVLLRKRDSKGELVDIEKRWAKLPRSMRRVIQHRMGKWPVGTLADVPLDRAVFYGGRDSDATFRLFEDLTPVLRSMDLERTMSEGMEAELIFEEMQAAGMTVSRSKLETLHRTLEHRQIVLGKQISKRFFGGRPFNPMSSDQTALILWRRGLQALQTTKTGKVSTSKKSIEYLRSEDEFVRSLFEWREMEKISSAFTGPLLERALDIEDQVELSGARVSDLEDGAEVTTTLDPVTGTPRLELFPVQGQIGTTRVTSRRLSMKNPNLLQVPTRSDLGRSVRECYIVPPGKAYASWDLSQIEVRCAAHISQDPILCTTLREGRDVHVETACRIFGLKEHELDKRKHRTPAKSATFGSLFGISPHGLLIQLRMLGCEGWDEDSCADLLESWWGIYSGIRDCVAETAALARKFGYIRDEGGMYRYLPGVLSSDPKTRASAEREAFSHRVQGMAQTMIQRSMVWIAKQLLPLQEHGFDIRWRLQVHDELILSFDDWMYDVVAPIVTEGLTQHHGVKMTVPVGSEGSCAQSWGALK